VLLGTANRIVPIYDSAAFEVLCRSCRLGAHSADLSRLFLSVADL
jgi:hypothetical protein